MADERIIELDTINEVPADGYLAIDTVTGDTYKILPIKIGAQYTIQDGDHSFTLVGSNGYSHTVNIPYDSKTINLVDFNQLTPEEQDNGTAYYVPDKDVPVADELWAKVGRTQLDGTTQDLSKAHNNLMTRVDDLEDTVGDTALPSGMSSVTDGLSQLNSSLNGVFKIVTFPNSATITVPANGAANVTANQMNISTPAGYTPVALSAFFCNSNDVVWRSVRAQATGNASFTVLRNVTSTSKDVILNCSLLCVKTNFLS